MIRDRAAAIAAKALDAPIRQHVADALAGRRFAEPADVDALKRRIDALEAENVRLEKKLSMATGALQAAKAQLDDARRAADEALSLARRAAQQATSATATAESALDGVRK